MYMCNMLCNPVQKRFYSVVKESATHGLHIGRNILHPHVSIENIWVKDYYNIVYILP